MASPIITTGSVFEDGGASLMARVVGNNAVNIVQADITSISRTVFVGTTISTAVTVPVVATVIFDTLQTDARWAVDSTGYNFREDVLAAVFPDGDVIYRVEYQFTPASGQVFWVVFDCLSVNVRTS